MRRLRLASLSSLAVMVALADSAAVAHPGRTDASGGHHDRRNGGYHYHGGGGGVGAENPGLFRTEARTESRDEAKTESRLSAKAQRIKERQERARENQEAALQRATARRAGLPETAIPDRTPKFTLRLRSGRTFDIVSYESSGYLYRAELPDGGRLTYPAGLVARVGPLELNQPETQPAVVPRPPPAGAPGLAPRESAEPVEQPIDLPQIERESRPAATVATVYVTRTGEKYDRAGCRYLRSSSIPMCLYEARARYEPYSVCQPPD